MNEQTGYRSLWPVRRGQHPLWVEYFSDSSVNVSVCFGIFSVRTQLGKLFITESHKTSDILSLR